MTSSQAVFLTAAATVGGALNSVAGGGTFVAFPALLLAGVPAVAANATCTFALWPGGAASAYAYRRDIEAPPKLLWILGITSLTGGAIGAYMLLHTSNQAFEKLIPPLLLFASLVFTFSGWINIQVRKIFDRPKSLHPATVVASALIQFVISVYGGYFGAGIGILMIAAWSALGFGNIHGVNGLRSVLGTTINGVALLLFLIAHSVAFGPGVLMAISAIATGYFGATYARRLPVLLVRRVVLATAWGMTLYFFWKYYHSAA
ncbi:MAG: sulfite exporter TauE/SafE family protein [Bryobacteraceae bacterium]